MIGVREVWFQAQSLPNVQLCLPVGSELRVAGGNLHAVAIAGHTRLLE